jgi:TnpA family transposase
MYIDESIIKEQWENILRLLCSIKLGEVKASIILKRLSSYSKQHPLYKAMKEIGRIHKTLFLLRYFDEPSLRQNIEKQLNKLNYHIFLLKLFFLATIRI